MPSLTKNFCSEEFDCKCRRIDCNAVTVDPSFVDILQLIRNDVDHYLIVNSGCRCKYWNRKVGGAFYSRHLEGIAADIMCLDSELRWKIVESAVRNGITVIGIYEKFIHLDSRKVNHPFLFWKASS